MKSKVELEQLLIKIWKKVLWIEEDEILLDSNLFELGLNSLTAILGMKKIHDKLVVHLPLSFLFSNPRISDQIEYIYKAQKH